jgi:transketolase
MDLSRKFDPKTLRKRVLQMAYSGSAVHIGCAFSIIEILATLYKNHLRYPENNPNADGRDYLVLSKGHGVMAQYACMVDLDWLSETDLKHYFSDGSLLKGLSDSRIEGLEATSGSLGHGLSVGVGLSLAAKLKRTEQKTFVIVGDGEINEGPIWEGLLFAHHHRLKNLMVIVDENGFQAMGTTCEVMNMESIKSKFESFGFDTCEVNGHNEFDISQSVNDLFSRPSENPKAVIAKTVKGKGVTFMEHDNSWHYTRLNTETYTKALDALESIIP